MCRLHPQIVPFAGPWRPARGEPLCCAVAHVFDVEHCLPHICHTRFCTQYMQATCTMTVRSSCRPACLHSGRAPCSRAHAHSLSCAHRQVRQGQVALQPAHLAVARPRARRRCGCIEQQGSTQLVTGMRKLECTSAGSASCKHPRATCLPATGDAPRVAVEGDTVVLHYVCRDESGNIVDDSREHSEPVRLLL